MRSNLKMLIGSIILIVWMIGSLGVIVFFLVKGLETWQFPYFLLVIFSSLIDLFAGDYLYVRLEAWVEKKETTRQ